MTKELDDLDDIGAVFKHMGALGKEKRHDNLVNSTELLRQNDIDVISKNDGFHLIVSCGDKKVDFWPSTGFFIFRNGGKKGRGVFKLMRELKK